jgi:hypothetical protein
MIIKIAIIVSMCANVTMLDAAKKAEQIKRQHPDAVVTIRTDKKCLKDKGLE